MRHCDTMSEAQANLGAIVLGLGVLLAFAGWIALMVAGFRTLPLWGLLNALLPVFSAPCFALSHWREARLPMALFFGGLLLAILGRWWIGPMH